jgi:hypothetical protein
MASRDTGGVVLSKITVTPINDVVMEGNENSNIEFQVQLHGGVSQQRYSDAGQ